MSEQKKETQNVTNNEPAKIKEHKAFYFACRAIVICIFKLLYRYTVIRECELPKNGSYIIASNHLSNTDPVFVGLTHKRRVYFMAKVELFKNKFFGGLIKMLGAFPVTRGANDGKVMTIFIEGGRTKTGELMRPRSGCAVIARQTKAPVVPMCITIVGNKKNIFAKRVIHIGKPLSYEDLGFSNDEEPSPREYREASRIIIEQISKFREMDRKDK